MLDIDLIQEKPALATEFRISLALDMLSAMSLVLDAPSIEGLDQWVYTTHSALSEEMRVAMAPVLILGTKSTAYYRWFSHLPPDAPAHRDFAAYLAWLKGFPVSDYQQLLDGFIAMLRADCELASSVSSGEPIDVLRACYGEMLDELQIGRLIQMYQNPGEFKAQLVAVLSRFWEQYYRQEFERCLPIAERSVTYHRAQSYGADLATTFAAVTGRRFPKGHEEHKRAERVIFVPSCYIGPYVMLSPCDDEGYTLVIHYNARPASTPDTQEIPAILDLFPPLKALADETRLQILSILDGRELYAQQIVDQLDISQSAVSRHLQLMVTGGVLEVRKEESMKYYAINTTALAALAEHLRRFRAP